MKVKQLTKATLCSCDNFQTEKKAHHLTPSSSHSNEEKQSADHRCRSAGNRNHSTEKHHNNPRILTQTLMYSLSFMGCFVFMTNLIERLVRADDHLRLVRVDSYELLSLWNSGMLNGSKQKQQLQEAKRWKNTLLVRIHARIDQKKRIFLSQTFKFPPGH